MPPLLRNVHWRPQESPDGAFVYFARSPFGGDIWRCPVSGGEENPFLKVPEGFWWEVGKRGLYYLDTEAEPGPVIALFNPVTREVTGVADLVGASTTRHAGLSVSPDGRSIFYTRVDTAEMDLMLIENFR